MNKQELKEVLEKALYKLDENLGYPIGRYPITIRDAFYKFIQAIETNPEDSKQAEDESKPEPIYAPDDMDEYPAFGKGQVEETTKAFLHSQIDKWRTAARKLAKYAILIGYPQSVRREETALIAGLSIVELFGDKE